MSVCSDATKTGHQIFIEKYSPQARSSGPFSPHTLGLGLYMILLVIHVLFRTNTRPAMRMQNSLQSLHGFISWNLTTRCLVVNGHALAVVLVVFVSAAD